MNTNKYKYEFMGIIKPFLPEEVRIKFFEDTRKLIEGEGGKIINEDIWGKRHLAYKIKEHEEGYYFVYTLEIEAGKLQKIHQELKMTNDLLRYIIIKGD